MADTLWAGTTLVEKESRSIGDVPIGGIVAWTKTLSGVPNLAEGWVECDGQTLSDALSPLNGQTIPDLNGGNRFMRGNSTSGGTGGSETGTAPLDTTGTEDHITGAALVMSGIGAGPATIHVDGGAGAAGTQLLNRATGFSILPTYYEVVWIMRVR